jgi:hypothetical protein
MLSCAAALPRPPVAPVRPDRHAPGPKRPHASARSGRQPATRRLSPRDSGKRLPYSKPRRRSPLSLWCHPQKPRNPRGSCALWIIFYSTFTTLLQNLYDTVRHLLVSSSVPGSAGGYGEQPLARDTALCSPFESLHRAHPPAPPATAQGDGHACGAGERLVLG